MNHRTVVHFCHWPDCRERVPPKLWGCRRHWFALPASIRAAIWRTYRPGQEVDKRPSPEYLAAAKLAQDWIKTKAPTRAAPPAFHEPKDPDQ